MHHTSTLADTTPEAVVADLAPHHVAPLLATLENEFCVDVDVVREAVRTGGTFNLIHFATAVKVDAFVAGRDAFDSERLSQRMRVRLGVGTEGEVWVDVPEYTVLRAQAARHDLARLSGWAERLGVRDLLDRAQAESR